MALFITFETRTTKNAAGFVSVLKIDGKFFHHHPGTVLFTDSP